MYTTFGARWHPPRRVNLKIILCCVVLMFLGCLLYITMCQSDFEVNVENIMKENSEIKHSKSIRARLVVLILSAPDHQEHREVIRQTWLSGPFQEDVKVYFSFGTKSLLPETVAALEYENSINGDILFMPNVIDAYSNLAEKVLQSFVWLNANIKFDFVFKGDDDTFVRMEKLIDELKNKPEKRVYWGFFDGRAKVKKFGKWAEPDWVLCDNYLPYARGGGYVLSEDMIEYIARNSHQLKLFNSEDVSVGAWLAPIEVDRIHDPRFDTEYKSRGCFNTYIVTHKQSPKDMEEKHENLKKKGRMCTIQFRRRYSYIYNWEGLPSECCHRNDTYVI